MTKTKTITKLIYGKFPYAMQLSHPALRFKNIRWRNRGSTLRKVESYMYRMTFKELSNNRNIVAGWGRATEFVQDEKQAHDVFKSWDRVVDWVNDYVKNINPDAIGRTRNEGWTITFYTTDKNFFDQFVTTWGEYCATTQALLDPALIPVLEQAYAEKTWLLKKEYVDHYPYNEYRYRIHLTWESKDLVANMVELFRSYVEADLIKLNGGFKPLMSGTGRIRWPANILVKSEDTLELIKLALGPSSISQVIEYQLVGDAVYSSP